MLTTLLVGARGNGLVIILGFLTLVLVMIVIYFMMLMLRLEGDADMWFFIVTDDGFRVFEILPGCVKPSRMFRATSLKASLDGVLSYVRAAYSGRDVSVDIDSATFDVDNAMVGLVRVVLA